MSNTANLKKAGQTDAYYSLENRSALAQIVCTGMLNGAYDSNVNSKMSEIYDLVEKVYTENGGPEFVAKLAVYARRDGYMKDMPAYLVSLLAIRHPSLYEKVFSHVINNGKMLRKHIDFIRSGKIDKKKSMPRAMRRMIRQWFQKSNNEYIFKQTVGKSPSMADVIKMIHPKPQNKEEEALFGYIIGREYNFDHLPQLVKDYESFKKGETKDVPDVPFQMLDSLENVGKKEWKEIAKNAPWQMTRMNLNTFARQGVFEDPSMVKLVADRLGSEEQIRKSGAFPYQLLNAYFNAKDMPKDITKALNKAMEIACENVPELEGTTAIFIDVSGSMQQDVLGGGHSYWNTSRSSMTCLTVAALMASALQRKNPNAIVKAFDTTLHSSGLDSKKTILENAKILASFRGGGTDVSLGFKWIANNKMNVDNIILISDNESWAGWGTWRNRTDTSGHLKRVRQYNPNIKLACIDLVPNKKTQAPDDHSTINIGGFSDVVFDVIAKFFKYGRDKDHWAETIDRSFDL